MKMPFFKTDVRKLEDKKDFSGLITTLTHRKADVRRIAADAIRRLAKKGIYNSITVKPLITSLSDEDESVRKNAAFALGDLANQSVTATDIAAVKPLTRLLSDTNWEVRWSAAFAINRLAWRGVFSASSAKPLIELLSSRSRRIRTNAAYALAYLARAGLSDTWQAHSVLKKIASSDSDHHARKAARKALEEMRKVTMVRLSKLMSYILRHNTEQNYPVELDKNCCAKISQLVQAISATSEWSWINRRHIIEMANKSHLKNKNRFMIKGDRIKAAYGITRDCPSTKAIIKNTMKKEHPLKPKPVSQSSTSRAKESKEIEIKRGYEILPNNDIRFGIRIVNNTNYLIADVETILDHPKTLLSLKGNKVRTLDNIHPNSERTAKYMLTPRECVHNEKIYATIIYKNYTGQRHTIQMQGKDIQCVCPFLREKVIRKGEFTELAAKSEQIEVGLSFDGIKPDTIADFIIESCTHRLYTVGEHEIDNIIILDLAGESVGEKEYYLLSAVIQPYINKESITQVAFRAYSDKPHGLHGFLNEITASIRHLVGSVQSAKEIGIIEGKQVINIIDSVVQRTSFGVIEDVTGMTSATIEETVMQRSQIDSTRRCPNCEKEAQINEKFCTDCGTMIK